MADVGDDTFYYTPNSQKAPESSPASQATRRKPIGPMLSLSTATPYGASDNLNTQNPSGYDLHESRGISRLSEKSFPPKPLATAGTGTGHSQSSRIPTTTMPVKVYGNDKSFAAREQARAEGRGQLTTAAQSSTLYDPISPTSTTTSYGTRNSTSLTADSGIRRGSVPDRSPLQKLEVTLGDIAKEEKRARVEKAEQKALKRGGKRGSHGREREPLGSTTTARSDRDTTSGDVAHRQLETATHGGAGTRQRSDPQDVGLLDAERPERGTLDFGLPAWNTDQQAIQRNGQESKQKRYSGLHPSAGTTERRELSNRIPEQHSRTEKPAEDRKRSTAFVERMPAGAEAGHGLSSSSRHSSDTRFESGSRNISGAGSDRSRQLSGRQGRDAALMGEVAAAGVGAYEAQRQHRQTSNPANVIPEDQPEEKRTPRKPVPQTTEPATQSGREKPAGSRDRKAKSRGWGLGARIARKVQAPDLLPREEVRNTHAEAPAYEVPPQTAAGQQAREQVGFGSQPPEALAPVPPGGHHRHLSDIFHRHEHRVRSYEASKPLDEWKRAGVASLLYDDFMVDSEEDKTQDSAWWERKDQDRRMSGTNQQSPGLAADTGYDGTYETESIDTTFQPALYLKCGPLLRYTGMRRETSSGTGHNEGASAGREVWRGTVMIVTIASQSDYSVAPTLRLFVQPMELLPPPPPEIDIARGQQLPAAYIDPLAGHPKVSRTGKLMYVKPVEHLQEEVDLSRIEDDGGLFEATRSPQLNGHAHTDGLRSHPSPPTAKPRLSRRDGEKVGKFKQVEAVRLHAEKGVTFWRFTVEVELGAHQARIAYRINRGPAIGFWVPARGQTMNVIFHSCNGFSASVNSDQFCGPDPMWRDVLNNHQTRPFHVMIGGGDQVYNDRVMKETTYFQEWLETKNPEHKHGAEFTVDMQDELEQFYLDRYSMWFSQGLFGMSNSQIPMINVWDDHDIIDGFGSYPHHFMASPVFCGLGAVAFKYYMLFQHQSLAGEAQSDEPSWLLGASPGPYINELSRNLFMYLGKNLAFLGLDCRTERMRDEILSQESYDLIFDRCRREIIAGETKHLVVLLGVPIAYPRLNFLENVLTSRAMDPIKALGRMGMLGGFVNKFDGGVEILDDLDDHWTAKHHKRERNWFVQELQELAAENSVRITILGGDVHLAAVGRFFSNKKLGIPKDRDHRYMPNIISSAIVNTPPPEMMGDILNRRNKIHHLDDDTDEDMIPLFETDVDGKPRKNQHLLPRRNWCSLREYDNAQERASSPAPQQFPAHGERPGRMARSMSLTRPGGFIRRLSRGKSYNNQPSTPGRNPYSSTIDPRVDGPINATKGRNTTASDGQQRPAVSGGDYFAARAEGHDDSQQFDGQHGGQRYEEYIQQNRTHHPNDNPQEPPHPNPLHRQPTGDSQLAAERADPNHSHENASGNGVNLSSALDIVINCEVSQKDPAGITTPYRMLVPALWYEGSGDANKSRRRSAAALLGFGRKNQKYAQPPLREQRRQSQQGWSQHGYDGGNYDERDDLQGEMRIVALETSANRREISQPDDERRGNSYDQAASGPIREQDVRNDRFTREPLVDEHDVERKAPYDALANDGVQGQATLGQHRPIRTASGRRLSEGEVVATGTLPDDPPSERQSFPAVVARQPSEKAARMLGLYHEPPLPQSQPQRSASQDQPRTGGLGIGVPYDPNRPQQHFAASGYSNNEHGPITAGSLRPQPRVSQKQQQPIDSEPLYNNDQLYRTDTNTSQKESLFTRIKRRSFSRSRRPSSQRRFSEQDRPGGVDDSTAYDQRDFFDDDPARGRPAEHQATGRSESLIARLSAWPRQPSSQRRFSEQDRRGDDSAASDRRDFFDEDPTRGRHVQQQAATSRSDSLITRLSAWPNKPQGTRAYYNSDFNHTVYRTSSARAPHPPVALDRQQQRARAGSAGAGAGGAGVSGGRGEGEGNGMWSSVRRSLSLSRGGEAQQRYDGMRAWNEIGGGDGGAAAAVAGRSGREQNDTAYQEQERRDKALPGLPSATDPRHWNRGEVEDATADDDEGGAGGNYLDLDDRGATPEALPSMPSQATAASERQRGGSGSGSGGRGFFSSLRRLSQGTRQRRRSASRSGAGAPEVRRERDGDGNVVRRDGDLVGRRSGDFAGPSGDGSGGGHETGGRDGHGEGQRQHVLGLDGAVREGGGGREAEWYYGGEEGWDREEEEEDMEE